MSEDQAIIEGSVWRHADGGWYRVYRLGLMKHPDTGDWLHSVSYRDEGNTQIWTTTRTRWLERFIPRDAALQPDRSVG